MAGPDEHGAPAIPLGEALTEPLVARQNAGTEMTGASVAVG
jgi:hypothetical protein